MKDPYGMVPDPKVGMKVIDDLTHNIRTITRIDFDAQGNMGIYLDDDYLDGGRFPWEISECPVDASDSRS
jgi:hypothetical protein